MKRFYSLYGVVAIQIEGSKNQMQYLHKELEAFSVSELKASPDLVLHLGPVRSPRAALSFHNRKYLIQANALYFQEKRGPFHFWVKIKGLADRKTILTYEGSSVFQRQLFLKYLIPLIRLKLLACDFVLVKSATMAHENKGYLFAGWSGSGKTSITLSLRKKGYRYLSDNFSLVSAKGMVLPFSSVIQVFWRNRQQLRQDQRIGVGDWVLMAIKHAFFRVSGLNLSHFYRVRFSERDLSGYPLSKSFFLVASTEETGARVTAVKTRLFIAKILATDSTENHPFIEMFNAAFCAGLTSYNASLLAEKEEEILRKALGKTQCCELIAPPASSPFWDAFDPREGF